MKNSQQQRCGLLNRRTHGVYDLTIRIGNGGQVSAGFEQVSIRFENG
jgi:hypothetical protein